MPYIGNPIYQSAFVTDTFSGDGTTTAFTMSVAPAGTTNVLVAVSGVLQDPSTYGVVGTTITFSTAPPSGTGNISCRYLGIPVTGVTTTAYRTVTEFTATAGQTTFTPPSYTVGFINVYRNGVLLGSADYTATNGTTVVLASGATSGDLVTVESFLVSSVLNAIPNTAGAVNSSAIATGAITQTKIATGVAGTGPAFSAYRSGTQTGVVSSTATKIQFNAELFDTANAYDSTTNYRFTPQVAGYYQINGNITVTGTNITYSFIQARKNGAVVVTGQYTTVTQSECANNISLLLYLNGTTDYVELFYYGTVSSGTITLYGNDSSQGIFSGFLARAA